MTRKSRRLWIIGTVAAGLGTATLLGMSAFRQNMVFFMAPSDLARAHLPDGRQVRLGGMVEKGSLRTVKSTDSADGEAHASFRVTDGRQSVTVTYHGILPDLFREGQGVVALGALDHDGSFAASEVLAKHDETYMPKEVAEALKKSGHWDPTKGAPAPSSLWDASRSATPAPRS